jgi:hypothetical protein
MIHKLEFINPELHDELNITVRRGPKWYDKAHIGDEVSIVKTGTGEEIRRGLIVGLKYVQFTSIRKDELAFEHDEKCKDIEGLMTAMIRAYPDFKNNEKVTVLSFWV